jgi:hypothetical protein
MEVHIPVNPTVEKYENPKKRKEKRELFPLHINILDNGSPRLRFGVFCFFFFLFLLLYYHRLLCVYPHVFTGLHKIYASLAGGLRLKYADSVFI